MHVYTYSQIYIHICIGDHYWSSHWFSNKQHYVSVSLCIGGNYIRLDSSSRSVAYGKVCVRDMSRSDVTWLMHLQHDSFTSQYTTELYIIYDSVYSFSTQYMSQYTTEYISFTTHNTHSRLVRLIHDSVYSFTAQYTHSRLSTWVSTRLSLYHSRLVRRIHDLVYSFMTQYAHSRLSILIHGWVHESVHDWVYIIHDS